MAYINHGASTDSIPLSEISSNGDVNSSDVLILPNHDARKRKLTEISIDSTEEKSEKDDSDEKDDSKASKTSQLKDAIMSGNSASVRNLLNQKIDLSLKDTFGRSPLHNAVLKGIPEIVTILLDGGASVNIQDDRDDTPLHYAARAGNPDVLKLLLSNSECDVNFKGSCLNSPLHIAASLNKPELCKLLLEHHANPNSHEENGKSPLGRAVESGAVQSATYLINYMKNLGISCNDILYNQDFDGTTLLHLAVDSGFTQVVELCLQHGATIRQPRRSDRTTAFHMACEQGSTAIVKLLVDTDPKISKILLVNAEGLTPLHQAAHSNSLGIAEILIENGANVNAKTNDLRTPLMYAAQRGGVETIKLLLEKGADPTLTDIDNRTAIFDAIGYPTSVEAILQDTRLAPLLTEKDVIGYSAAHYAAKKGDAKSVSLFLDHNKASATTVSDQLDTPLHVAAKYGAHEVIRVILERQSGKIINAQNSRNRTALHLACSGGHFQAGILLLDKGATIERDQHNRTALHEAAQNGAKKVVEMVVNKHSHCLNFVDDDKNTALHLAVRNGHSEIIHLLLSLRKQEIIKNATNQNVLDLALDLEDSAGALALVSHERWREILESCNTGVTNIMKKMVVKMPDVAEQIFENCIIAEGDKTSPEHKVRFDLNVILRKSNPEKKTSLEILKVIADNRIENCLTHNLTFIVLSTKWNSYGWLAFFGSLLSVLIYLIPLTIMHAILEDDDQRFCPTRVNISETGRPIYLMGLDSCPKTHIEMQILHYVIIIIICIQLVKETTQVISQKLSYVNATNLIELVAFLSALISLIPTCECKWGLQKESAAVSLFFGWINLIMYLQGLPFYGKYVIMLYTMFITLIKVMVLFCLFALAFGTTFHLIIDQEPFTSLPTILMNMFIMTLGEINYVDVFMPWEKLFYPFIVNLVLILFCLTMPIILMNMLVGLSVGDIDAIEQSALIDRYVLQIGLLNNLENSFPRWLLKRVQKNVYIHYPNKTRPIRTRIFDALIGFGEVDTEATKDADEKELHRKVADLNGRLEEQTHTIDDMKSTLAKMFDMMKEAERAREDEKRTQKAATASKSVFSLPTNPIGANLPSINIPFGAIGSLAAPFGSKKSEEPPKDDGSTA